jgi:ring-1,2-phenylacetyl-CoA epoxidase subunit PaaD
MPVTYTRQKQDILDILASVKDPEVPVLSVIDLGIIRDVRWAEKPGEPGHWEITITPTYSGCPAMDMIAAGIRMALYAAGVDRFDIRTILAPAWTTAWMTPEGMEKLRAYGIAPPRPIPRQYRNALFDDDEPSQHTARKGLFECDDPVPCPRCGSTHTKLLSEFGSTACKSLHQCEDCKEPFDYFKCH